MIILVCELRNECFGYIKVYHKLLILFYFAGSQPRSVSPYSMVRMCLHLACFMRCPVLWIGRLSSPFGHQDVAAAVNYHQDPLGCKMSPSINCSTRQKNQNLELQSGDVSFTITNHLYCLY